MKTEDRLRENEEDERGYAEGTKWKRNDRDSGKMHAKEIETISKINERKGERDSENKQKEYCEEKRNVLY